MAFPFKPFSPKQRQVLAVETDRKIVLLDGPVRSGKTIPSIVRWLAYLGRLPRGTKVLMTGKTLGALRNNILDPIEQMLGPGRYYFNRTEGIAYIDGRRARCVGAHDEASASIIRGDTVAGWYADEIVEHPKNFVDLARTRVSQDPGFIIWTCNPEGRYHFIHQEYLDPEAPAVREGLVERIPFELDDNWALPEAYKRQLKASFTGVFFKRNVLGLWVVAEGIIYDGFDLKAHGFDDGDAPAAFDRLIVALDYGTQNPFHALLLGVKGDETWYLKEWRYCGRDTGRQKTDGEYSRELRIWLGQEFDAKRNLWTGGTVPDRVIVDPSATSFIAQLRKDGWHNVTLADNDVTPGIMAVANRLGAGKIHVHRQHTAALQKEIGSYAWDPKAAKRGVDEPLKANDHGVDAWRYGERTLFGGRQMPAGISVPDLGGSPHG